MLFFAITQCSYESAGRDWRIVLSKMQRHHSICRIEHHGKEFATVDVPHQGALGEAMNDCRIAQQRLEQRSAA